MILFAARMIRILLAAAALLTGYFILRKKISKKTTVVLGISIILTALLSYRFAALVPPLTDSITLTALGEGNEVAQSCEVFLDSFTVDGETFACGTSLKISDGHWFWSGESCAWRPEWDARQPEGMTRSVTIEIPAGWERALNFNGNIYRGRVEIRVDAERWTVDTYSEDDAAVSVAIGRSQTSALILNQIRCLTVYAILLAALSGLELVAASRWDKIKSWNRRHKGIAVFGLIALFQFAAAVMYSGNDCFWYDELFEIAWSEQASTLWESMFVGFAPLPIFRLLFSLWYLIAPYGERWLLLPFEIGTAAGVFFVGLCGKEWRGVRTGIFSALFAAVSSTILVQCSYEIRSYGFYFASSAVLLYLYLRSWRANKRLSGNIWLAVAMIFFAGMHYHAVILCIALFLIDAFAFFRLKVKTRSIWPYLAAAISYIPNVVYALKTKYMLNLVTKDWQPVPSLWEIRSLVLYLSGQSALIACLFLLGVAIIIISVVSGIQTGKNYIDTLCLAAPLFLIAFVVTFFTVYGNLIRPGTSLWCERYFCDLLPCFLLCCGLAVDCLCEFISGYSLSQFSASSVVCVFLCLLILPLSFLGVMSVGTSTRQPYRGAADWLYSQANYIYNNDTLILSSNEKEVVRGWNDYYLTRQGSRDAVHVASAQTISMEDLMKYRQIYFITLHGSIATQELVDTLASEYHIVGGQPEYGITVYQRNE